MIQSRNRFMRIMLFFDLPTITSEDRRQYRKFHKTLIKNGYLMIQESVYVKLSTNYTACNLEIEKIKKFNPKGGIVQCLVITENQYAGIININGETLHSEINSLERFVVL